MLSLCATPDSRSAAGVYETKRPQLQHDSLSLAAAALAGVPPRTADDDSTSSSSGSISETGYSSEDDMASNSSLGTDQGILAGMAHAHGLEHAMVPPGSQHRPPMSSVKTTYKLRVGVLEGTTFLNQVRNQAWWRAVTSQLGIAWVAHVESLAAFCGL